ncbi:Rad52/Rad22 family DNA repair protein [Malaciobacter mytili]|uniref:Rad52/Rad22 family DNA repair protein n=1 Tax=Malaciobacter mytili TaxID=603050 RepID=UPI003BB08863
MFNDKQLQILNAELDSSRIKMRDKGNISLSYIEGHDAIETANRVFGFGNWDYAISKLEQVSQEVNQNQNTVVCYKAVVQVLIHNENHIQDVSREDVGFGTGVAKTLADAHEGAAKEAVTDALKRALRSFGNQFGNSLYSKDKNHTNNQEYQTKQQNFKQPANTNHQQYNQPQNQSYQQPYKYQQDFNQLINLGLQVIQQNDILIVTGENVFANKDVIKAHGFRWDGASKSWYMQLRQAA